MSRLCALIAFTTLAAAPAFAQPRTNNVTWEPDNQERFNAADCDSDFNLDIDWDLSGGIGIEYDLHVYYQFDGACDPIDQIIDGEFIFSDSEAIGQGLITYENQLSVSFFLPFEACFDGRARDANGVLCFHIYQPGSDNQADELNRFERTVTYDTTVPETPPVSSIAAVDGTVSFSVSGGADAGPDTLDDGPVDILVQLRACDDTGVVPSGFDAAVGGLVDGVDATGESDADCGAPGDYAQQAFSASSTSVVTVSGLTTASTYEIRVLARDDFFNVSPASDAFTVTPIAEVGPLGAYTGEGTPYSFTPDCSQSGTTPLWVGALLLGLLGLRRRPGRGLLVSFALALSMAAAPVLAGDNDQIGHLTIDLRVSPLLPDIDRDPGANGLYACFFQDEEGNALVVPEIGLDFGYSVFDAFGSVQLGIGFSAAQVTGVTFDQGALVGGCDSPTSTGRSQLTMLKIDPHLAYRFDWLLDEFWVPVVPYAEIGLVGLGYTFTRNRKFDDGGGDNAGPMGMVFGWEGTLGLALELSFLDTLDPFTPNTAKRARERGSLLHPFIFAEVSLQEIDNFGGGGFVFSPRESFLQSGLPMMFRFGLRLELP